MRIAVMGAGALGGYFGGRLAAAGHDVTLIARGAHLAALRAGGLHIRSPRGDLHLTDIGATDNPAEVGPVDVVMFMVKNYDLDSAGTAIKPMIGPDTMVVTCQNGISAPERLSAIIGAGPVVGGVARIPANVPEPGVINHSGMGQKLSFGEVDGTVTPRVTAFRDALIASGCNAEIPANITHDLWTKFISQATLAGLTTLTRQNIGPLLTTEGSRELFYDAMRETDAVARAVVPDLPEGVLDATWARICEMPGTMHASMLDDLLAGKRIEVAYFSGDVRRLGRAHGVPTPIHDVIWAALQPMKNGTAA